MKTFIVILLAVFLSSGASAAVTSGVWSYELGRRQTPNVTSDDPCYSPQWQNILNAVNVCTRDHTDFDGIMACECTFDHVSLWASYYSCYYSSTGSSLSYAQNALDGYLSQCNSTGHPLNNPPKISATSGSSSGGSKPANGAAQIDIVHAVAVAVALCGVISASLVV